VFGEGVVTDHPDREFTAFIDRVEDRFRKGRVNKWLSDNRHMETPAQTWRRRYDAETEKFRDYLRVQIERKAS
jgi:hypothetical protein